MTPALETAIAMHRRGHSVMPVLSGKTPLVKWKQWQNQLPPAPLLSFWQRRYASANWGIITGEFSGLFIVESDSPESTAWIEETVGIIGPVARSSQSWKRHYYFRHPGFEVKTCAGLLRPNLDVRGEGGYAVLPGSVHHSGAQYRWLVSPNEAPLLAAPDWFLEMVPRRQEVYEPVEVVTPAPTVSSRLGKWAQKVLEDRVGRVVQEPDGRKHQALLDNVPFVAGFIPYGAISEEAVRMGFYNAVQSRAKSKAAAMRTINGRILRGIANPSRLPPWAQ